MIGCPNCGSELKYDIATAQMLCKHCDSGFDPYKVSQSGAEERTEYEVTIFTCPQCGGEIVSQDTTAAGFCSFCGASTILSSRVAKEKRPDYIIPFRKTKEDCKDAYKKVMQRAIYAPNELKDMRNVESFRGIYMPYWVYYIEQKGDVVLHGEKEHRQGDYIITSHYSINLDLDNYYKGLSYDASSSFADNISTKIAPYDVKNMKEFTPAFLSGFYADLADVGADVYEEDAFQEATDQTERFVKNLPQVSKLSITDDKDTLMGKFHTRNKGVESAMFPVWFMAYRNRDRVAYATINGQTGKVMVDLPVDIGKYLLGTLVIAAPIFVLLNMFLTMIPQTLVSTIAILAAFVAIIYGVEFCAMAKKETYGDDKGALVGIENARKKKQEQWKNEFGQDLSAMVDTGSSLEAEQAKRAKNIIAQNRKSKDKTIESIVTIIIIIALVFMFSGPSEFEGLISAPGMILVAAIVSAISFFICNGKSKKLPSTKKVPAPLWIMLALVVSLVVLVISPVDDLYYYAVAIFIMISCLAALVGLITNYNILATRKLPQFDYHGGDDRA